MKIQNGSFRSIEQLQDQYLTQSKNQIKQQNGGLSFQEILNQKATQTNNIEEHLKFSKHATNRLSDRNIELTTNQLDRLNEGTKKASTKGINDSLVIVDSLAFIVNVPSNTVVTAMDQAETKENIFTNIDGAVIV